MKYKNHELADLFPMMPDSEIADMAKDIKANGQRNPIVIHEGKILDGRNRYAACVMAGIDPIEVPFKGKDALSYVLSTNLHRRHLSTSQRAMVAEKLANMERSDTLKTGSRSANLPIGAVSQSSAAEKLNVSERSVRDARAIRESSSDLAGKVLSGEITIHAAKERLKPQKFSKSEVDAMPFNPDQSIVKDDFGAEIPKKLEERWATREQVKGWINRLQEIRREVVKEWELRNILLAGKKRRSPLSFNSFDSQIAASITDMKAAYPRHLCPVCNGDGCDYCAGIGIVSDFFFKTIPETLQ
jgi:ParB-like chromosome segregation protein Spo0J